MILLSEIIACQSHASHPPTLRACTKGRPHQIKIRKIRLIRGKIFFPNSSNPMA
jgi:hypothetical protein